MKVSDNLHMEEQEIENLFQALNDLLDSLIITYPNYFQNDILQRVNGVSISLYFVSKSYALQHTYCWIISVHDESTSHDFIPCPILFHGFSKIIDIIIYDIYSA